VQTAEAEAGPKAFHCLRPNCDGWWIVDDRVLAANWTQNRANRIRCPVCKAGNCIQCRVIHEGMNCREYQDDIRRRSTNERDARTTQEGLDAMLRNGQAQRCPRCNVIIIKHGGCTHMKCTMCQLDFTWTGVDQ
jgi:RanBP-type and C3HC4-type zinc finger-containing protein 1